MTAESQLELEAAAAKRNKIIRERNRKLTQLERENARLKGQCDALHSLIRELTEELNKLKR